MPVIELGYAVAAVASALSIVDLVISKYCPPLEVAIGGLFLVFFAVGQDFGLLRHQVA